MITGLEEMQKLNKDGVENAMKTVGTVSKGLQAIAVELADYSKKNFEDGTAALEQLMGAKTLDKAIEVQSSYMKSSYEGLVSQMTKLSEMYVDLAKTAYQPYEGMFPKVAK
jgi:hypothetical protein